MLASNVQNALLQFIKTRIQLNAVLKVIFAKNKSSALYFYIEATSDVCHPLPLFSLMKLGRRDYRRRELSIKACGYSIRANLELRGHVHVLLAVSSFSVLEQPSCTHSDENDVTAFIKSASICSSSLLSHSRAPAFFHMHARYNYTATIMQTSVLPQLL
jgi:hypothetical protein